MNLDEASRSTHLELDRDIKDDLISYVKENLNTQYGKSLEAEAITTYELEHPEEGPVRARNDCFYKKKVRDLDHSGYEVWVGGRIDGRTSGGHVIEIKNRLKRFLTPLPQYDIAQLQTYLHILDCPRGDLVEHLKLGQAELQTKSTSLERDLEYWHKILEPNVCAFARSLVIFMSNPELQRRFVTAEPNVAKDIVRECWTTPNHVPDTKNLRYR